MSIPARRVNAEKWVEYSLQLSDRHRDRWGDDCPAVDADFLLIEYNHGTPVAVVDYKHHSANLKLSNDRNYEALGGLYDVDGNQLPLFIARYWPETWAFKVLGHNDRGRFVLQSTAWQSFSEQQYVRMLYRLRKDTLDRRDQAYIERLNTIPPPREAEVA